MSWRSPQPLMRALCARRILTMTCIKSGYYKWFTYSVVAVMSVLGFACLSIPIFDLVPSENSDDRLWLIIFFLVWNIAVLWLAYLFLLIPTTIIMRSDNSFLLRAPLRTLVLRPLDIEFINTDSDGDWSIIYKGGKADLRNFKTSDLVPLIEWISSKNPLINTPFKH